MKQLFLSLWQFPQTITGLLAASFYGLKHEEMTDDGMFVLYSNDVDHPLDYGQVSIIPSYHYRKEFAESLKRATLRIAVDGYGRISRWLGPLFFFAVLVPRGIHRLFHNGDTSTFYGDKWAAKVAGIGK